MTRHRWALTNGVLVVAISLVAAAWTRNPNWPWNIPLGMFAGYLWGLVSWPVLQWLRGSR